MRTCRGCGAGGKSADTLDLIEHYWDAIERDFARINFDARDWLRGTRPWSQFWNFCDMFSNTEGSWLQDAQAADDRHLARWEQLYEQALRDREPYRPPLAGYDALRAELRELRNDFRQANGLPPLPGPASPLDRIKERKRSIGDRHLDDALGYKP